MGRRVMEIDQVVAGQSPVMLGLTGAQVIQRHVQFGGMELGYHPVHDVQELPPTAAAIAPEGHGPAMRFQGGKEGGGPVVRLSGYS